MPVPACSLLKLRFPASLRPVAILAAPLFVGAAEDPATPVPPEASGVVAANGLSSTLFSTARTAAANPIPLKTGSPAPPFWRRPTGSASGDSSDTEATQGQIPQPGRTTHPFPPLPQPPRGSRLSIRIGKNRPLSMSDRWPNFSVYPQDTPYLIHKDFL